MDTIDVNLKSAKLQKQYSLEANKADKLSDIASFLKNLREMNEFIDESLIIFKESPSGQPIPHYLSIRELIRAPS